MRYPWVNIGLLVLVAFQTVTGFLGLISGSAIFAWILRLHDIGGYAVVVLLFWKALIIFDVLNRLRRINWARLAFLILAALLVLILATGLLWPILGYTTVAGFSLMTIHALAVVALSVLFAWHAIARRFVFNAVSATDRRAFLRLAGITLAGIAVWQISQAAQVALALPGAVRRFTGSFETGSHTGQFPLVSWLFDAPAPIARAEWQLWITGAVDHPLRLDYAQIAALANDAITATIDCTGGWYSTQEWTGFNLSRLLDMAGVQASARSITVHAISGYNRRFSLEQARTCLLALRVAGQMLDHGHGFPARLVAPGQRGFNWVKWVTHIEVNETSELLQPPVPLQ